jgi:PKD repeat protein
MELSNAITDSTSPMELVQKARDVTDKYGRVEKVSSIMPYTSVREAYEMAKKSAMSGLTSGVPEIDLLTAGFQQGTMAVVAGFTSHGKSTVSNNFGYLNAAMGKKVGVISLEIPELMCKYIYLSRHSATILPVIEYQTIIRNHLSEEEQTYLFDIVEKDFEENVGKNLSIIGQDSIPSFTEAGFQQLYESIEEALGGLDMVIWDHVNQFKYVNFDNGLTGDHCINWLTNLTKSYVTKQGTRPVTIAVTQTNREGYKSASRKGGKYELTALQDFNELEKSATYVIFTYADEGMRVNRESKMQLLKHRLGMVQVEPESIVVNFSYAMVGDKFVDHITSMTPEVLSSATDVFFDSGSMSEKNLSTFEKNIHSFESAGTTEVKTVVKSKNETDSGEFLL